MERRVGSGSTGAGGGGRLETKGRPLSVGASSGAGGIGEALAAGAGMGGGPAGAGLLEIRPAAPLTAGRGGLVFAAAGAPGIENDPVCSDPEATGKPRNVVLRRMGRACLAALRTSASRSANPALALKVDEIASSDRRTCCADSGRCRGSLASRDMTKGVSAGGRSVGSGGTGLCRWASKIARAWLPANGA